MNNNSAFGLLLVITIATAGLAVFYNLYFRESFPVAVSYSFPAIHRYGEASSVSADANAFVEDETPEVEALDEPEAFYEPEVDYADEDHEFLEEYGEEDGLVEVQFPLDLNTATLEELKFIPQVGDVTAQRIVQYREALGGYTSLEQLMEIKGIAEKSFERIAPYLYIE